MERGTFIVVREETLLNIKVENRLTAINEVETSRVSVDNIGPDHEGRMSVDNGCLSRVFVCSPLVPGEVLRRRKSRTEKRRSLA